jgi:hypothetical protein
MFVEIDVDAVGVMIDVACVIDVIVVLDVV